MLSHRCDRWNAVTWASWVESASIGIFSWIGCPPRYLDAPSPLGSCREQPIDSATFIDLDLGLTTSSAQVRRRMEA